ncbi:MAG TPA: hypothetical protein VF168_08445 [Trueperaceae bacterium]
MKPGSLPWLLRHELRLTWRELTSRAEPGLLVFLCLGLLALVHAGIWYVLGGFLASLGGPVRDGAVQVGGLLLLAAIPIALAVAINRSVSGVFERADLDLLAASPLSSRVIFSSRVLAVALQVFLLFGVVLIPVANIAALVGAPRLLGLYPTLLGLSLAGASLGMLITLALVRSIGARRARTVSQLVGSFLAAGLFLLTQVPTLFGNDFDSALAGSVQRFAGLMSEGGALGPNSLIWLPARAIFFDPLAVIVVVSTGILLIVASSFLLHRSFAHGASEPTTSSRRVRNGAASVRFSNRTFTTLLFKEWRLILRDPYLISQTLVQLLYLVPLVFLMFSPEEAPSIFANLWPALAAGLVVLTGTLASNLVRICVYGEEADDLIAASPTGRARVERMKVLAGLLPVWFLALPGVLAIAFESVPLALLTAPVVGVMTLSVAVTRLWNRVEIKRADLFRRNRNQGDKIVAFLEGLMPVAWAAAVLGLGSAQLWGLIPLAIAVGLLGIAYLRVRPRAGRSAVS